MTELHPKRVLLLVLMIIPSLPGLAQVKDTLYFFNGSKLVGELNKIRLGFLEFDATGIGILKIKNHRISSIHARSRNFRVELINGQIYEGYLMRSEQPGNVIVYSSIESKEVDLKEIANLVYFGQTWKSRLNGSVGAGYSYTKSSAIGRFNMNATLRYNTARTETQLTGDLIWTVDSSQLLRDRENLNLGFTYSFRSLWSAGAVVSYQRNLELGLERRLQQAFLMGRKLLISRNQQGLVFTGLAINQENNLEGVETQNAEWLIQANYNFFSFANPNITLAIAQSGYFSLNQKGRVRSDGSVNASWEIISDFSVNLQFYHNYDSQSPATGEANTDYGFVAGLSYKF